MGNFSIGKAVNMAPSGIATFAKTPICNDIAAICADIAVIGAPCDIGIQGRSGARLGPRGIRLQSTRFKFTEQGSYDPETDRYYLSTKRWRIFDCGDIDYIPGDVAGTLANIEAAVRLLKQRGSLPVVLGGDHSVSTAVARGLDECGEFYVVHLDAHLDWTAPLCGQTLFNGSPCRMMAQLPYIQKIIHMGIHGIGSSGQSDFREAKAHGDLICSPREVRRLGAETILRNIPQGSAIYVTFDIDAMDYSIAAGTGSPMLGGFGYDEMREILQAVAARGRVIALDCVEVSPPFDDASGTTCYLAARLIADFLGYITGELERAETDGGEAST